jgi:cystathionine beta-lyase/cystathionine gamma-synthase
VSTHKSLQTLLSHSDYTAPDGFGAFPTAIHHASTVTFKDVEAMRARSWQNKSSYTYGLHGTPTSFTLEARLAEIEDAQQCLLAPSGLAAIALVNLGLLKSGDDVLLPENAYGPNRDMAHWLAQDHGISARDDPAEYASTVGGSTRLGLDGSTGYSRLECGCTRARRVGGDRQYLVSWAGVSRLRAWC